MKLSIASAVIMIVTTATGSNAKCCLTKTSSCPSGYANLGGGLFSSNDGSRSGPVCCTPRDFSPDTTTIDYCRGNDSDEETV